MLPQATTPTEPEPEVEHAVPEPGDDLGVDTLGDDSGTGDGAPVPAGEQSFSSGGGSITVNVAAGGLSLVSTSPASGFGVEVHDHGRSRIEVRFNDGRTEWRIRIEIGNGGLTSEITQHDSPCRRVSCR